MKPFTLASSASSTLLTSNIVTNSLTDDLNILTDTDNNINDSPSEHLVVQPPPPQQRVSTAQRERQREASLYHDDIDWLLADRKCASLQTFYATTYDTEPKLWRRILMYL
jgi:hypothetical protein